MSSSKDYLSHSNNIPNDLIHEKSPYLIAHAYNPVRWYAWSEKAFEEALKADKPILLSIGYSTCHWCHVMEKESFSNAEVANVMNEGFVCIKVDREERPDVDSIYMSYVMATTGHGGWPMTVFLTPDRLPFYGGTYFPPEDRYGVVGFKSVLTQISSAWKNQKNEIYQSALSAKSYLAQKKSTHTNESLTDQAAQPLDRLYETCENLYDLENGGFGRAPKFPRPHLISALFLDYYHHRRQKSLRMAIHALDAMALGGIYDHLEGGFHRYSTDAKWRIPHFEKMLYDQALLLRVYGEGYQITHKKIYRDVIEKTVDYIEEHLISAEGMFRSAEDSDSLDPYSSKPEHREGAFYLWSYEQLKENLTTEQLAFLVRYCGVKQEGGNSVFDPHGELKNYNVIYLAEENIDEKMLIETFSTLKLIRDQRQRPFLDDKILLDWNALTIDALAFLGLTLKNERYIHIASRCANALMKYLKKEDGSYWHRYRDGHLACEATLSDYAFLSSALISLYEATANEVYLNESAWILKHLIQRFWDSEDHIFFMTADTDSKDLFVRPKELYDSAIPAGNSAALWALSKISLYPQYSFFEDYRAKMARSVHSILINNPESYPMLLQAYEFSKASPVLWTLLAHGMSRDVKDMLSEIYLRFNPDKTIMFKQDGDETKPATAMFCRERTCSLPMTLEELKQHFNKVDT